MRRLALLLLLLALFTEVQTKKSKECDEIPRQCSATTSCNGCCKTVTCKDVQRSYCIPAPQENELCDPESTSCSCDGDLVCQAEDNKKQEVSQELEKYLNDICKYEREGKGECPDRKKLKRKHKRHYACKQRNEQQSCDDNSDCASGNCCLTVECNMIEKKPKVAKVSFCQPIPSSRDPCDSGSTMVTCPCEQNLTCSSSATTKYGDHRKKYYKCLCKHDDLNKCEKEKKNMAKYESDPGPVCLSSAATPSLSQSSIQFVQQCNTDSNCPSEDCCLTTIACKEITDKPNIENLPVCQPIPNRGDPCDFSPVNTTCSCLPNFICHPSGSTSHKDPKKDKYYKYDKCLCEHRNNFKQCEKYKKYKTKYKHSVCQPVPPKRLNLCNNPSCGSGNCCANMTCTKRPYQPTPDIVAFCLPTPAENETCDPKGCPCENGLTCKTSPNNRSNHKYSHYKDDKNSHHHRYHGHHHRYHDHHKHKHHKNSHVHYDHKESNDYHHDSKNGMNNYVKCLCKYYYDPSQCKYSPPNSMTNSYSRDYHHSTCQRVTTEKPLSPPTSEPTVPPIRTPRVTTPTPPKTPSLKPTTQTPVTTQEITTNTPEITSTTPMITDTEGPITTETTTTETTTTETTTTETVTTEITTTETATTETTTTEPSDTEGIIRIQEETTPPSMTDDLLMSGETAEPSTIEELTTDVGNAATDIPLLAGSATGQTIE
ncbi:rho GTPase-activating protein gacK-like isoform X2 [Corticium candelabrum]|uniref:rho GTPase-activating protein gacK-like isoform X2 n=1 Tax=Corticium candelabrum TaxID=121492 RepID=UPI002E26B7AC|nr:rho GTPase-activating protein gacK-like isoform X2 [Corticium candelabrum]